MKKGVWRSQISWLFLIHYELSEKQKKIFWFFTVFWGDLEGVGTMCPPRTQATFKSPATLGLISEMVKIFVSPDGILRVNVG